MTQPSISVLHVHIVLSGCMCVGGGAVVVFYDIPVFSAVKWDRLLQIMCIIIDPHEHTSELYNTVDDTSTVLYIEHAITTLRWFLSWSLVFDIWFWVKGVCLSSTYILYYLDLEQKHCVRYNSYSVIAMKTENYHSSNESAAAWV